MTDLTFLPCPFCGEVPTIDNVRADENQGTKWGGVVCPCGIVGPEVRTGYEAVEKWADRAAEEWNNQHAAKQLAAALARAEAAEDLLRGCGVLLDRLRTDGDVKRVFAVTRDRSLVDIESTIAAIDAIAQHQEAGHAD